MYHATFQVDLQEIGEVHKGVPQTHFVPIFSSMTKNPSVLRSSHHEFAFDKQYFIKLYIECIACRTTTSFNQLPGEVQLCNFYAKNSIHDNEKN